MSKRLQVVVDDAELDRYRRVAGELGLSLGAWVRGVLRRAEQQVALGDGEEKLDAIRSAARHEFPAPGVEQMLAEIERGYDRHRA